VIAIRQNNRLAEQLTQGACQFYKKHLRCKNDTLFRFLQNITAYQQQVFI
jgi:hypothetical protein